MKKVVKLTESDLIRIIERVINEGVTGKVINSDLSKWLSFKLGPKVLSGDFVSKGSLVTFNGIEYPKHIGQEIGNKVGSGTWKKMEDVITLNFK
jgi:hypothetical protein